MKMMNNFICYILIVAKKLGAIIHCTNKEKNCQVLEKEKFFWQIAKIAECYSIKRIKETFL